MSEWQPIETAPKDGTTVLIWCPDYADMGFCFIAHWETHPEPEENYPEGWIGQTDFELVATPSEATHWMPLPEPPK